MLYVFSVNYIMGEKTKMFEVKFCSCKINELYTILGCYVGL